MNTLFEKLKSHIGTFHGEGINHEQQDFTGKLTLVAILGGKAYSLKFIAVGKDKTVYHKEESTIAPSIDEKICLWNLNSNSPGLVPHTLMTPSTEPSNFVFAFNDIADKRAFREQIALKFWDNGDISYTYSWGMPEGEFKERSDVRMAPNIQSDNRPEMIKHYSEIQEDDNSHYRGSNELLSIGSPLAKTLGLKKLGIHHELVKPGRRTSWPHAESDEEEFAYVIEGFPDVWIDGHLHPLQPGDAVGFPVPTGISHTFINNSNEDVRLLVVGEANKNVNKVFYPLHPDRNNLIREEGTLWEDHPQNDLGPHDGLPDALRGTNA